MIDELRKRFNSDSFVSMVLGLVVVLLVGTAIVNYFKNKSQGSATSTDQSQSAENKGGAITSPTTYTVAEGDTLWSISEKEYKTGYNWVDLAKSNNITNPELITAGQALTIPVVTPIVPAGEVVSGVSDTKLNNKTYTVVAGDSLWSIAEKEYQNGYKWTDIAQANNLSSPDLIFSGNQLTLP